MQLRPYQRESLDALYAYWAKQGGNGLIVLPTGSGKSLVLAAICQELLARYPDLRIGIVTHVRELIQQNFIELMRLWPTAPAGIYSAGIGRRDVRARILFCGIQSVHNKSNQLGGFDLLLVDEAHLIPKNSQTSYGRFIAALREETPDCRVVGLTATPFRLDSGRLDRGKDRLFDKIVYEANVAELIEQGYLSQLVSKATAQKLDVSGVQKRGGEYIPGQLEIAVDKDWITRAAVDEMARYGHNRKAWLAFCAGVKHAEHVRDAVKALGISCECVTGETPKGERDSSIARFRNGQLQCLTSVGVLGTGFNVPHVDMIALLRPTQSAGLYLQQVGRALRKAPSKGDALILDFAGLTKMHGPIDMVTATASEKAKDDRDEPLAKECPQCATLVALAKRQCPTCDYMWPEREETPKHDASADASTSILSKGAPTWVDVDGVRYYRHQKQGSPDSMRVEYSCGLTVHKEWVCFSHQGFARSKAEIWWNRSIQHSHSGTSYFRIPKSTEEALDRANELPTPTGINVRPSGKYFEIVGRRFDRVDEVAA